MNNVVCMKWGTRYGPEYVNKLHSMVRRHLTRPFRFVCLTDDPSGLDPGIEWLDLPKVHVPARYDVSPWRKLGLLSPRIGDLEGAMLFLDLDVVIVDNIDGFFEHPGEFCIIENWTQKGQGIGNSSVFRIPVGRYAEVLEHYERHMDQVLREFSNEQIFISRRIGHPTFWPDAWCRSFKRHCLPGGLLNWIKTPTIPEGTRIVVFHGDPKPPDAAAGVWPGEILKHVRPTPWINDHWR